MGIVLIKVSLVIIVLWAFYKVLLEKETFFTVNRMYLLGGLIIAFILPFISLPNLIDHQGYFSTLIEPFEQEETATIIPAEQASTNRNHPTVILEPESRSSQKEEVSPKQEVLNDTPMTETVNPLPIKQKRSLAEWLVWIYLFGVLVFFLNLLTQVLGTLFRIIKNDDKIVDDDYIIVNMTEAIEPCSFFKYIFINPASYDYPTYEQIIAHEKIHIRKWHTLDLLLAELAVIVLWFNPFIWLFRKEVEKNIEYQTDNLVVNQEVDTKEQYQMNLLKIATHKKPLAITTNYNQSLIKQRILKMNAKKSNPYGYWQYAFVAPMLFALMLFLNKPHLVFVQEGGISTFLTEENDDWSHQENQPGSEIEKENEIANVVINKKEEKSANSECQQLVKAAKKGDLKKVKKILSHFNPSCMPNLREEDYANLDYIKFLLSNEGEVHVDAINQEIVIEGIAISLVNHNYEVDEDFGNRIKAECKEIYQALKDRDRTRIKALLIDLDENCIENAEKIDDLKLTQTILKNGGEVDLETIAVVISLDELVPQENIQYAAPENEKDCKTLLKTIKRQDVAKVKELLKTTDVNCIDPDPEYEVMKTKWGKYYLRDAATPLVAAARLGNLEIGQLLFEAGAKVNFHSNEDETPLMAATASGELDFVKYLVEKGAEVNTQLPNQGTALLVAANEGQLEILQYLQSKGAKVNIKTANQGTPLIAAANNGHTKTVEYLLSQGAKVDLISPNQGTPLIAAANNGHMKTVEYLLSQGAKVDLISPNQGTPLIAAANNGHMKTVEYLLSQGAKVDLISPNQGTPLIAAANNGHMKTVEYLLSQGAKVDLISPNQGTPLIAAANNGHISTVEFLIAQGARIDLVSPNQGTALISAVQNRHYETAKILLDNGADPYLITPNQGYAMSYARNNQDRTMIDLLKKYAKED